MCNEIQIADFPTLKIKECMVENSWDVELLVQLMGWNIWIKFYLMLGARKMNVSIW